MRRLIAFLAIATAAIAQTTPAFEVASVKPAGPLDPAAIVAGKMKIGVNIDAARADMGFLSLADLIRIAYRVKSFQLSGPDWMGGERFNIQAKIPEGVSKDLVPEMLQALLIERFKLAIHRETKDHAIYALVVGKGGHKMKEAEPDAATPPPDPKAVTVGPGNNGVRISGNMQGGRGVMVSGGGMSGGMKMSPGPNGGMRMEGTAMSMPMFAEMLARFVDKPIVDMTELKGNYQLAVDISMEEIRNVARASGLSSLAGMIDPTTPIRTAPGATVDNASTTIFQSVQALGLKLEPRKAPAEIIVIDHLEKMPTEN